MTRPFSGGYTPPPSKRAKLEGEQIETMVATAIQVDAVWERLKPPTLDHSRFRSTGRWLSLVWQAVASYHERHHLMPDALLIRGLVADVLADSQTNFAHGEEYKLDNFLGWAFSPGISGQVRHPSYTKYALDVARRFADESLAESLREQLLDPVTEQVSEDVFAVLQAGLQAASIASTLTGAPIEPLFDDEELSEVIPVDRWSTGITPFDWFLNGGHQAKEVYSFLGPIGVGKTVVTTQAFCWGCQRAQSRTVDLNDGRVYKAVMVSYESPREEIRERCLVHMAQISRERFNKQIGGGLKAFRGPDGPLLDYEREIFSHSVKHGLRVPSEQERLKQAIQTINRHGIVISMLGIDAEDRLLGGGGIAEIAGLLAAERQRDSVIWPICCWIDHAAAMGANAVPAEANDNALRRFLKGLAMAAKRQLASPYEMPVWVIHQLNANINASAPGKQVRITDGDECRLFGMYFDAAIAISQTDMRGLGAVYYVKARRTSRKKERAIRIDGAFQKVLDYDKKYVVDNGRVMLKTDKDAIDAANGCIGARPGRLAGYRPNLIPLD